MTSQNLIPESSDTDCTTDSRGATGLSRAAVQCLVGLVAVLVLAGGVAAMSNGGQRPTIGGRGEASQTGDSKTTSDGSPERIAAELAASGLANGSRDGAKAGVSGLHSDGLPVGASDSESLPGMMGTTGVSGGATYRSPSLSADAHTTDPSEFGDEMADATDWMDDQQMAAGGGASGYSAVASSVANQTATGGITATPKSGAVTSNATPTLPVRTIDVQIPVGKKVELFTDSTLATGWSDPDNTADWLCLTFTPERRDFWLDGADCEGKGLWAQVSVAGTYVINVRVREATAQFPAGVGPQSDQGVTLRLIAS